MKGYLKSIQGVSKKISMCQMIQLWSIFNANQQIENILFNSLVKNQAKQQIQLSTQANDKKVNYFPNREPVQKKKLIQIQIIPYKKMHIEPKEYLSLLDEIEHLKDQNLILKEENAALANQLVLERQKQLQHEQNAINAMKVVEELHAKAIAYEIQQKQQILQKVTQIQKQTKTYLQSRFTQLQNSSLTQVKSLELQSAKTKLDYYELVEFVGKVRGMYNSTLGLDVGKMKKEASLMDLTKWLKSLPGVAVSFMKTGFSVSSNTTGIKKKTLNQSRFKENRIPLSASRQKSRAKL